MKELNPIDPKRLRVGQTYFTDGLLVRFVKEQKNTRSSYFIFEPLPGQKTQRLIKLGEMKLRHTCFNVPAGYDSHQAITANQNANEQLPLF